MLTLMLKVLADSTTGSHSRAATISPEVVKTLLCRPLLATPTRKESSGTATSPYRTMVHEVRAATIAVATAVQATIGTTIEIIISSPMVVVTTGVEVARGRITITKMLPPRIPQGHPTHLITTVTGRSHISRATVERSKVVATAATVITRVTTKLARLQPWLRNTRTID